MKNNLENKESESKSTGMDYVSGGVTVGVTGVAGGTDTIAMLAFAGAATCAGFLITSAAINKKAGILTGLALTGAAVGSYLTSSSTTSQFKSRISALQEENSALVQRVNGCIYPSQLDGKDYLTIVSPNNTNHYQLIGNNFGKPVFVPLEHIYSSEFQAEVQKQKKDFDLRMSNTASNLNYKLSE